MGDAKLNSNLFSVKNIVAILAVVAGIWISQMAAPHPKMGPASMVYIGIFVWMLVWMVLDIIPEVITALMAMCLFVIFNAGKFNDVFAPLGQETFWLIAGAFGIAAGVAKSGLLTRITYAVMKLFPGHYKGQITAIMTSGLVISPLIPSLAAKTAILMPLAASISKSLSFVKGSKGAIGLWGAAYFAAGLFGNAFFSGGAFTFFTFSFLKPEEIAKYDWFGWLGAVSIWALVLIIGSYLYMITVYKPTDYTPVTKEEAIARSKALGSMSFHEKASGVILAFALIGWMIGGKIHLNSAAVGVGALLLLVATGVLTKVEFRTKVAWETAFFIGAILSIAGLLTKLNVHLWLSAVLGPIISPLVGNPFIFLPLLCIITYVLRYVVVSQMATATILFAVFGSIAPLAGLSLWVVMFTIFMSTQVWNLTFHNTCYVAAVGAMGSELADFKDAVKMSYAYMVINLVGIILSIPLWKILGFITI